MARAIHPESPQPAGPTILVVDRDRDCADSVAMLLNHYGLKTIAAYDEGSAIFLSATHPPDAALIDVAVLRDSGYDLARTLRRSYGGRVKLVAYTDGSPGEDTALATAGFDASVGKDAEPIALLGALSPQTYELVMRSAATALRQLSAQADLAESMLRHSFAFGQDREVARRMEDFLLARLPMLARLLGGLPLAEGEKEALSRRLHELSERLAKRIERRDVAP